MKTTLATLLLAFGFISSATAAVIDYNLTVPAFRDFTLSSTSPDTTHETGNVGVGPNQLGIFAFDLDNAGADTNYMVGFSLSFPLDTSFTSVDQIPTRTLSAVLDGDWSVTGQTWNNTQYQLSPYDFTWSLSGGNTLIATMNALGFGYYNQYLNSVYIQDLIQNKPFQVGWALNITPTDPSKSNVAVLAGQATVTMSFEQIVPEPRTYAAFAIGLAVLVISRKRRRA